MSKTTSITYREAGVDIDAGEALVERIKGAVKKTRRPEVLTGLGGFGALCEIPSRYIHPVLVSGTDGVGTKLKLASQLNRHSTIGVDLVAMCVNDIVVCGAEPLQFLDYYATGKLDLDAATEVITGIAKGCELAGCALVGGETAEMPGMYDDGDYDLAGFCVGVVEKNQIIDGSSVKVGDRLIGLQSSGVHSNGYSLVRKLLERTGADPENTPVGTQTLADALMEPTRIYVKNLLKLASKVPVGAMAHITGGGLTENLPRVLPKSTAARINTAAWPRSPLFEWIQKSAAIDDREMLRTFNCGIGMVVVVPELYFSDALELFAAMGEQAFDIGEIVSASEGGERVRYFEA